MACAAQVAPLGSGWVSLGGQCRQSGVLRATHKMTRHFIVQMTYKKTESTLRARSTRYSLERGKPEDRKRLFELLWMEKLNVAAPLIDMQSFIVAVTDDNDDTRHVVGGGRLGRLADGVFELSSVVIDPKYRGKGLGRELVGRVLALAPSQSLVYLITVKERSDFYVPFGFQTVESDDKAPCVLRVEKMLGRAVFNTPNLIIMVRES